MGNKIKRRYFFESLIPATSHDDPVESLGGPEEDPLFIKYSRKRLSPRHFVSNEIITTPQQDIRIGNITSGLNPYAGPWTSWEVNHLLRRTSFGVRKTESEALLAISPSDAVDLLLTVSAPTIPSPTPLNHYQNTLADSGGILLGQSWTTNNLTYVNATDDTNNAYRRNSHINWSWGLSIDEPASIREKMVNFWYHFIPVNFDDVRDLARNSATQCHDYMKLLRENSLGNYKTLIQSIAKMPAMLVYLGNQYSTASIPNENFARELMELFTLGKVPTQNYTEDDVRAASKVLSGWRVANFSTAYPFTPGFNATYHNQSSKTFSAFFGNTVITNQAGAAGANEFDIFFNMLFTQQQTTIAKYLCRRLYRFFVYYDIDNNIETNVITPLSALLISSNWEMMPVMKKLLKSEHFYDAANKGVMIKNPQDLIAGLLRTMKVNTTALAGANQVVNQYTIWQYFHNYANNNMEQGYGLVPNVSGWKAYYQDPTYYQNWINSNTIQRRAAFITSCINGFSQGGISIRIDVIAFVQQYPNATIQDPDLLINAIVEHLFPVNLSQAYKDDLKVQNLLAGQITNSYWTTAWNNYTGAPANSTYLSIVQGRLRSLLTALLQLAEFQLM